MKPDSEHASPHTQKAINHLGACRSTLEDFQNRIRAMVDDVINTVQDGHDGVDVLMAWEIGQRRAEEMYFFLLSVQEEAIDFTDDTSFDQLEDIKKATYIDALQTIQSNIRKLHAQYRFFVMIYHIHQFEEAISVLWKALIHQRDTLLSRQLEESIGKRGSSRWTKRISSTRARLKKDTQALIQKIEELFKKPSFQDMEPERQNEFYDMWKKQRDSLATLDDN